MMKELASVVERFPAVQVAFAYGSGVFKQRLSPQTGEAPPMIDFVFAVENGLEWHALNLSRPGHSQHYSVLGLLGPSAIYRVQSMASGVYYNTLVDMSLNDKKFVRNVDQKRRFSQYFQQIKYGVVDTRRLVDDLIHWDSLYLSGRLHKPVESQVDLHFDLIRLSC